MFTIVSKINLNRGKKRASEATTRRKNAIYTEYCMKHRGGNSYLRSTSCSAIVLLYLPMNTDSLSTTYASTLELSYPLKTIPTSRTQMIAAQSENACEARGDMLTSSNRILSSSSNIYLADSNVLKCRVITGFMMVEDIT